jgi:hypothetical protein
MYITSSGSSQILPVLSARPMDLNKTPVCFSTSAKRRDGCHVAVTRFFLQDASIRHVLHITLMLSSYILYQLPFDRESLPHSIATVIQGVGLQICPIGFKVLLSTFGDYAISLSIEWMNSSANAGQKIMMNQERVSLLCQGIEESKILRLIRKIDIALAETACNAVGFHRS